MSGSRKTSEAQRAACRRYYYRQRNYARLVKASLAAQAKAYDLLDEHEIKLGVPCKCYACERAHQVLGFKREYPCYSPNDDGVEILLGLYEMYLSERSARERQAAAAQGTRLQPQPATRIPIPVRSNARDDDGGIDV